MLDNPMMLMSLGMAAAGVLTMLMTGRKSKALPAPPAVPDEILANSTAPSYLATMVSRDQEDDLRTKMLTYGPWVYILSDEELNARSGQWGFSRWDVRRSTFTTRAMHHICNPYRGGVSSEYMGWVNRFRKRSDRGLIVVLGMDRSGTHDPHEVLRKLRASRKYVVFVADTQAERERIRLVLAQASDGPVMVDGHDEVHFDPISILTGDRTGRIRLKVAGDGEPEALSTRLDKARRGLQALDEEWLAYRLDLDRMFLHMPRLRDDEFPATLTYRKAMLALGDALTTAGDDTTDRTVHLAERALMNAEEAWSKAQTAAGPAGTDSLPPREQAALRRAHHHIVTLLEDPSMSRALREDRVRQLRTELDRLETVPVAFEEVMAMPQLVAVTRKAIES